MGSCLDKDKETAKECPKKDEKSEECGKKVRVADKCRSGDTPAASPTKEHNPEDVVHPDPTSYPGPKVRYPVMANEEVAPLIVDFSECAAKLKDTLDKHGAAVVTNVLSTEEERATYVALKKEELQRKSPQQGDVEHTQGELSWKARLNPRVREVFARAFGTHALSVSTDAPSKFYTPEGTSPESDNKQWLHVDQFTRPGDTPAASHLCYQGILYVLASTPETSSTTALWPGSHRKRVHAHMVQGPLADEISAKDPDDKGILYGDILMDLLLNGKADMCLAEILPAAIAGTRLVPVPAGAVLLWDSTTVHQGWSSGERFALPVCWEPRERVGEDAKARKLFLAAAGFATCHSPSEAKVQPSLSKAKRGPPAVRPWCVLPEEDLPVSEYEKVWEHWKEEENVKEMASSYERDSSSLAAVLRPEVVEAL